MAIRSETGAGREQELETVQRTEVTPKTQKPPMYKVVMLNDDFTPMDFVVYLLKTLFHHAHESAVQVMLQIHHGGTGICGVYTRDVAETKIDQAIDLARKNTYPLQCVMEQA